MARWLLKTEPSTYSFDQLVQDKKTTWDGVANATALQNIRAMKRNQGWFLPLANQRPQQHSDVAKINM